MAKESDPTEAIRRKASGYPGVDPGTACTQSSFKVGGRAFLFVGPQGGRYKAMFRLKASLAEATRLAAAHPEDFQVGSWVTARFSTEKPLPQRLWSKWLDESYGLSSAGTGKARARGGGAGRRR
jgi:hypothetical protein